MTCTTATRRTSLPALLLAAREAEAEYKRLMDDYDWSAANGDRDAADRNWRDAEAARDRWAAADTAWYEATYPVTDG